MESDKQREEFEQWYVENTFDYPSNPIGSPDCGLQRKAWQAAQAAQQQEIGRLNKRIKDLLKVKTKLEESELQLAQENDELRPENARLRKLVVMKFSDDRIPQFSQGYSVTSVDDHDLIEPVTADDCNWYVHEIARLNADNKELRAQFAGSVTFVRVLQFEEMIEQLRAENERLNAKVVELSDYLHRAISAKDSIEVYKILDESKKAIVSIDTTWLDRKMTEAKRDALQKVKEVFADDSLGWWSPNAIIEQLEILEADLKG